MAPFGPGARLMEIGMERLSLSLLIELLMDTMTSRTVAYFPCPSFAPGKI